MGKKTFDSSRPPISMRYGLHIITMRNGFSSFVKRREFTYWTKFRHVGLVTGSKTRRTFLTSFNAPTKRWRETRISHVYWPGVSAMKMPTESTYSCFSIMFTRQIRPVRPLSQNNQILTLKGSHLPTLTTLILSGSRAC